MRTLFALGWIGLVASCGGGGEPRPALLLDVTVGAGSVWVFAIEADRPDACNQRPFSDVGVCDQTTDGWSCDDPMPADWLGELRVEVDGEVVGTGLYDAPVDGSIQVDVAGTAGAVLVIAADDGEEIELPLPSTAPPLPSIVEVIDRGDDLEVSWTSTPAAASAVIGVSGGFGGPRCHVAAPASATLSNADRESGTVFVQAFAAPVVTSTGFGEARVWVGGGTSREL